MCISDGDMERKRKAASRGLGQEATPKTMDKGTQGKKDNQRELYF